MNFPSKALQSLRYIISGLVPAPVVIPTDTVYGVIPPRFYFAP